MSARLKQQQPTEGSLDVLPFLIPFCRPEMQDDLRERTQVGIETYGHALQTHNGRDPLVDAYQEALDLIQYIGQYMLELDVKDKDASEKALIMLETSIVMAEALRAVKGKRDANR